MKKERSKITPLLRQEEGVRYYPYVDSRGYPTIGVGFKIGEQFAPIEYFTMYLSDFTIDAWLQSNIQEVQQDMSENEDIARALTHCNQPREDILTSMAYQMGVSGLAEFQHMLAAIDADDFERAAAEMLDSAWASQTPERANREADVMRSGKWEPTYDF